VYIDGIPSYEIKGVSAVTLNSGTVTLNHINTQRYLKGMTKWDPITFTLYDPVTPSGAQAIMEWVRLHHESVTGRDGYSDMYKKDLTINVLGPVGDIVSEWKVMGAIITSVNFGDYSYDDDGTPVNIALEVQPDYCVLNY
jgi:hypothetical protein